ncbi:MAG TPA: class I SAM-dependent methyltransferase [Acidimicrobiia bacterium]|jgi:SAM-dependent methyltransferase
MGITGAAPYAHVANVYDTIRPYDVESAAAVSFLSRHAGDGSVLELGVGTGRLALPLRGLGFDVVGLDASSEMLAVLREKPDAAGMPLLLADMSRPGLVAQFSLVFCADNALFALLSADEQTDCLRCAATLLSPGGLLVLEAAVPASTRRADAISLSASPGDLDEAMLQIAAHDVASQTVEFRHVHFGPYGVRVFPAVLRYASPAELDSMAAVAGLELRHRYGGWTESGFTGASARHISVYGLRHEPSRTAG